MFKSIQARAATLAIAAVLAASANATDITGAGSSFVFPVVSKWSAAYHDKTGNQINYQSIGSGGGIAQIKAATVDFGASDAPLKAEDLQHFGLGQFPVVVGGIVPIVHVPGVQPGQIKLTGDVLADIFLGSIKKWNDPRIAQLNPGMNLSATPIKVVHRADGSGTTFNFTNYLSKVNKDWQKTIGFGTTVAWPACVGAKGNDGVAAFVRQSNSSIGYVEFAYARQNHLSYAVVQNAASRWVEPNANSFAAAAATADWASAKDFNVIMTNAPGPNAWPITATTWVIMYKKPKNAANSKVAFDFFRWSLEQGQPQAMALDYVPLPQSLVGQIEAYWKSDFRN
jgi:phosphate transport system substrate-binding protein